VKVERLLLLVREKLENLDQDFSNLRVQLDVVFGFLADFDGKQPQAIFYFFIGFSLEVVLHAVKAIEELKEPY
jgi:hypothetical protein